MLLCWEYKWHAIIIVLLSCVLCNGKQRYENGIIIFGWQTAYELYMKTYNLSNNKKLQNFRSLLYGTVFNMPHVFFSDAVKWTFLFKLDIHA